MYNFFIFLLLCLQSVNTGHGHIRFNKEISCNEISLLHRTRHFIYMKVLIYP